MLTKLLKRGDRQYVYVVDRGWGQETQFFLLTSFYHFANNIAGLMLLTCEIVDDFRISRGQSCKKMEMAQLCHPLDLCLQCSTRSLRHSTFLTQLFPQMTTVLGLKSRD